LKNIRKFQKKNHGFLTDFLFDFIEIYCVFQHSFDDISAICWWKLAGMISSCNHKPVVKQNGMTVSICDLNNYLVYTDVSKFNSWIERVIIDSYNSEFDGVVDETSAGQSVLGNTFQLKLFFLIVLTVFFF
jgi:hypothetical protein